MKQKDKDEKLSYSPVVNLFVITNYGSFVFYPNPVLNRLTLNITLQKSEQLRIQLINNNGKVITRSNLQLTGGNTSLPFDVSNLKNGIYYIEIMGISLSRKMKFIKQ